MKDKKRSQYSINDLVKKHQVNGAASQRDIADDNIEAIETTQEELLQIAEYNKAILTLDETYTNVVPMSKILVRVFLLEPHVTENGILEPHKQVLTIPTQNGMGSSLMEIESPFPYANKAIVVAVPPMYSLIAPGDIVQLDTNPVKPIITGHGANATIHIPASYMHPSAATLEIPRDCTNKHYGYLLIPFHEISTKITQ